MRALVSRSIRPRIGTATSFSLPSSGVATRQAVFSPTRRKLTFNDAFTILLAPVFALAFIGDATLKDRRKKDWEQKIAEVKAEIEAIRERELQAWSNAQLRSVQLGIGSQRRQYTTAARAVAETQLGDQETTRSNDNDETSQVLEGAIDQAQDIQSAQYSYSSTATADWQQYESLVATKLVLELLLHIRTGKSWVYRAPTDITLDPELFPDSLDILVKQLQAIRNQVKRVQKLRQVGEVPAALLTNPDRQILHNRVRELVRACREGSRSVQELVYGFARAITQTKATPYNATYRLLVEAFMAENEDLAYLTTGAILSGKQRLTDADVQLIIAQYGKFKGSGKLSSLLRNLAKKEGRGTFFLDTKWSITNINGVQVPAPRSRQPMLLATMIRSTLQCGMERFAEAYTALLFTSRYSREMGQAIRYVLTYFSEMNDWVAGTRWLRASISHMSLIANEMALEMPKNLVRILELCVTCGKEEVYEHIMKAIIATGIDLDPIDETIPILMSDRIKSIRKDWADRLDDSSKHRWSRPTEQAKALQQRLAEDDATLTPYIGITDLGQIIQISDSEISQVATLTSTDLRPLNSLSKLLTDSTPSKNSEPAESIDRLTAQQIRISELEAQLAKSRKQNIAMLNKMAKLQEANPTSIGSTSTTTLVEAKSQSSVIQNNSESLSTPTSPAASPEAKPDLVTAPMSSSNISGQPKRQIPLPSSLQTPSTQPTKSTRSAMPDSRDVHRLSFEPFRPVPLSAARGSVTARVFA